MAAQYVEILRWTGCAVAGFGGWRYVPLVVIRLTAAFTKDDLRQRRCLEVLRLARRDAAQIPSYLPGPDGVNVAQQMEPVGRPQFNILRLSRRT
jgi:hypothetical protein